MNKLSVLLAIPCFNEQETITTLMKEIKSYGQDFSTIIVDDGSHDATYQIASQFFPTIRHLRNLGIGGAVQTGIMYAEMNDFDCCIQLDGDGQHPPSEINKLLRSYNETQNSIIIGSRYLLRDTFQSTWTRRLGSYVISQVLNILFPRCNITDPTSGMRLMDRKAIKLFAQRYPHDFPEPISIAWALKEGLVVSEIAVKMRERKHGNSSIVGLKQISYMLRVLGYIVLSRFTSLIQK
jgi:glycosyltransferase involved in cell wall biosynthesis